MKNRRLICLVITGVCLFSFSTVYCQTWEVLTKKTEESFNKQKIALKKTKWEYGFVLLKYANSLNDIAVNYIREGEFNPA
jgi:hypothetical protein